MRSSFFRFLYTLTFSICLCSCQNTDLFITSVSEPCQKIELTPEEAISISFSDSTKLEKSDIIEILNEHTKKMWCQTHGVSYNPIIKNITLQNISSSKTNLYIVDFELEGSNRAYISGDRRFPYVLASFKNDNNFSNNDSANALLAYSKNILSSNISQISHLKDSLYQPTISKIEHFLQRDFNSINKKDLPSHIEIKNNPTTRATLITTPPEDAIAGNGPFISVSWNCGMPYNQLMPQTCPDNWLWDNRHPISSVVVATAQILSFFRPNIVIDGNRIDWTYLCEKEEIHNTSDYFGSYVKDPDD